MRTILYPVLISLGAFGAAYGQTEVPRFSGSVGGGFTTPAYTAGEHLNTGWNALAGAGINISRFLGVEGQFQFNGLDINSTTLNNAGFPGGDMHLWSLTLDPVIHFAPSNRFNPYIIGGGGLYHRTIEFTAPTIATVAGFDPFLGIFFPIDVPANQVLQSMSVYKGGVNIGMGFSIPLGSSKMKLFAEARYHHMYTRPDPTTIIPVTLGIRW